MNLDIEFSQIKSDLNKILRLLEQKHPEGEIKMYDLADLQKILQVSRRTIFNWKEQGKLPCTRIGSKLWVSENQLEKFLEQQEEK
jgi:excisionase family DNA binding protein